VAPLFQSAPIPEGHGLGLLVLVPTASDATDLAATFEHLGILHPVHATTGLARTERLLRAGSVRTLIATPADAVQLLKRASLKLDSLPTVAIAWVESLLAAGAGPALDIVLAEARSAQRLIITADEKPLGGFVERYAHRAPIGVASRVPETPVGPVRYLTVDEGRRSVAVRATLDQRNPAAALVWDPLPARHKAWIELVQDPSVQVTDTAAGEAVDLVIAVDLVSPEVLRALSERSGEVVVVLRPGQVPYLGQIAHPIRPTRIVSEADRARDRAAQLRQRIRERLNEPALDAELLALQPLFDEYDPALVAAAAAAAMVAGPDTGDIQAWLRIHVGVGRNDHLRPADLVGALVNSVGIPKDHIGKIDIRDSHALVEIQAGDADQVVRGLTGVTLRGRRVTARVDRR
jgi:ATP-dependent RNA helicase DeaD